jgi:hypothetical protein
LTEIRQGIPECPYSHTFVKNIVIKKGCYDNSLGIENASIHLFVRDLDYLSDLNHVRIADVVELRDVHILAGVIEILFSNRPQRVV